MSEITTKLGLTVYDDVDDPTVKTWRDTINKNAVSSAFKKIDAFAIDIDTRIDNLEEARKVFRIYATEASTNNYIGTNTDLLELVNGIQIQLSVNVTNSGSAMININSLGSKVLQKISPLGVATNLEIDDLIRNKIYTLEYQDNIWIMMDEASASQTVVNNGTPGNLLIVGADKNIDESSVTLVGGKISGNDVLIGDMLEVNIDEEIVLPTMNNVTPGTYIGLTVDSYGRIINANIGEPPVGQPDTILHNSSGDILWSEYAPNSLKLNGHEDTYFLPANGTAVNSDKLQNLTASDFAYNNHNHNSNYLGINAQAVDSALLDGIDSLGFARQNASPSGNQYLTSIGGVPTWVDIRVAVRAYSATTTTLGTSGNLYALPLELENIDTHSMHDNVTNNTRLICVVAGIYLITGLVNFAVNATGNRDVLLRLNGTTYISDARVQASLSGTSKALVSVFYALAVNDYVELIARQYSGGSLDTYMGADYSSYLGMVKLCP